MLRHSLHPTRLCSLFHHHFSTHTQDLSTLTNPELLDRITHLLTHHRYTALATLTIPFSNHLLNQVLINLKLNPNACLHFFNLASKQQHFRPHVKSNCKLIHILSKAKLFYETRHNIRVLVGFCEHDTRLGGFVFDELVKVYREFGFSPTVFDVLLKVCAEKGLVENALHVFDEMPKLGKVPSLLSCNSLLSCLVRKREFYKVGIVFDQMRNVGIVPDVFTCSIVVNAYCKDGRVGKCVEFVKEMEEEFGVEPNIVTYHSLINGYVGIGDVGSAEGVLKLMKERGVSANVVTYTLFVKGYCKQGKVEEAEKVIRDMKEEDPSLVLDEQAYGVLIDRFCRTGNMNCAVRIRDEMLKKGLKVNLFICSSMINGYCKFGQVDEASRIVKSMGKWKLRPDFYSYNTLLNGY